VPVTVQVADAAQRLAVGRDAEAFQLLDGVWHQPLATGLVYGAVARFDDDDRESRACAV
jgi:hypothetical protein